MLWVKSMNNDFEHAKCKATFYGSATVGERGQLVIPAEARAELGIQPGDKMLIMRHPAHKGLMMFQIDAVREFLDEIQRMVAPADAVAREESQ